MSKRLLAVAAMVGYVETVFDVGCDHAHLSIDLIRSGRAKHVVNIDVNRAPLTAGRENVARANLGKEITFIQSDGLKGCVGYDAPDVVTVTGLGLATILGIVDGAPFRVPRWVLASNNYPDVLRAEMVARGYTITSECVVFEHGVAYEIVSFLDKLPPPYRPEELFFGPYNIQDRELMWRLHAPDLPRLKMIATHRPEPHLLEQIKWITQLEEK